MSISVHAWQRHAVALGLLLFAGTCAHGPDGASSPVLEEDVYRRLVTALADDALEGRGVQTEGNARAAAMLEKEFRAAGLEPGADGAFQQCFEHTVSLRARALSVSRGGMPVDADALAPAPFSASANVEAEIVFAGYGIHAAEDGYDDYAKLDPRGKILVVMRFEPRERDAQSPLNGDRPSRHSELRRKAFEAKTRGAVAVLFVVPPGKDGEADDKLPALSPDHVQSSAGLPAVHVRSSVVDGWLAGAGTSLKAQVQSIDDAFASEPVALGRATVHVELERGKKQLCNVVGVLPGRGDLADQALVIGAHFDHLGYGQSGTMAPGERAIHNGADDNASGAAGLVVLARAMAGRRGREARRTVVFVAFNGEEVGLAGSSAYVADPYLPLKETAAMLNLDMIGRLREGRLVVLGSDSGDTWGRWLQEASNELGLQLAMHGDGYGPSDQTAFYSHGVPVLHFFTGAHEDYHRPSDDADRINYDGAMRVLRLVERVARRTATNRDKVAYRESSKGPAMGGDSRGYGAYLGSIPDYTAMSPGASGGVKLSGVRKGGPADKAGIRAGDRVVAMGGRTIDNLYDMTYVLRDHRPGTVIEIVVDRGGKKVTVAATLGSREEKDAPGGHGAHAAGAEPRLDPQTSLYPGEEKYLADLRQLTFAGENAEAYWSPDGTKLIFQARGEGVPCDRIYILDTATKKLEQVSSGEGRTTCGFYDWPRGDSLVYASTHLAGPQCPPPPDRSQGYVWPIYAGYDLFRRDARGRTKRLTTSPAYDAEATECFKDGRIVFTSLRNGDLDLYVMGPKQRRGRPKRITTAPGYDGGAFFSPDCSRLVWRASRPEGEALEEYRALLAKGLVRPSVMELFVAKADGSEARQITHNGAANFAPSFLPDNRHVIFSSNLADPNGRNFDLYLIDPDAGDPEATLEQVTYSPEFEAFPMFSPDGKTLAFAANRLAKKRGDTNIFIATWVR